MAHPYPILDNFKHSATQVRQGKGVEAEDSEIQPSNLYLKTLLACILILLTVVLILLYQLQSHQPEPSLPTSSAQDSLLSSIQFQRIQQQASALEGLVSQEKIRAENQKKEYEQQINRFIEKIAELQTQLDHSKAVQKQINEQLVVEKHFSKQLTLQLESEISLRQKQEIALARSDSEKQSLDKNLIQEKQRLRALKIAFHKDQTAMADIAQKLEQKKSELIKNKRMLAESNQALRIKSRNLTISKGQNIALNSQISTLAK